MLCTNIVLNVKTKTKNNFCTQHVLNLYFSGNSMNNLLSYCGLTDARMRASEKDLPVICSRKNTDLSMLKKSSNRISVLRRAHALIAHSLNKSQ